MLISTTSDLLRVVKTACEFFRHGSQDIRISIIDVNAAKQDSFHDITNAGAVASSLGFDEPGRFSNEWLFLGRIKSPAIVHQIRMDQAIYERITWIFPSLAYSFRLQDLREQVKRDFGNQDPVIREGEEASDDGRTCAMFAECFDFTYEQMELFKMVLEEARKWKGMVFVPDQKYNDLFLQTARIYMPLELS